MSTVAGLFEGGFPTNRTYILLNTFGLSASKPKHLKQQTQHEFQGVDVSTTNGGAGGSNINIYLYNLYISAKVLPILGHGAVSVLSALGSFAATVAGLVSLSLAPGRSANMS